MTVRYHQAEHGTRLIPEYVCQKERIEHATEQTCQHILGAGLDATIADLLLAQMTPFTLDMALQVYEELQPRCKRHNDYETSRSNVLAMRQSWHSAVLCALILRIACSPQSWKPNGMP